MLQIVFAFLAGVAATLQNSINGLMSPFVGAMGVSLATFGLEAVFLLAYQMLKDRRMLSLKGIPFVYYLSGVLAAVVVGTLSICVARMGSAVTTCCSVAGQILCSTIIDHFGFFGFPRNRFTAKRLPGFLLIISGVLLINLLGNRSGSDAPMFLLLLATCVGGCAVIVRTLNSKASQIAGSPMGGGFVNTFGGTAGALILFIITSGFKPSFSAFTIIPVLYYSTAIFGTACLLLNIAAYNKMKIFYATIFMLIGQVGTGIIMDIFLFKSLSAGKCVGIVIILIGVAVDKLLPHKQSE